MATAIDRFDEKARRTLIPSGVLRSIAVSCCGILYTRACCIGRLRCFSFSRCFRLRNLLTVLFRWFTPFFGGDR